MATIACSDAGTADREDSAATALSSQKTSAAQANLRNIVPAPVSVQSRSGQDFSLTAHTVIGAGACSAEVQRVGEYLAGLLRPATGFALPVRPVDATAHTGIVLLLGGANAQVGTEGYELDVTTERVILRANTPAGLFAGAQTLRQLFPANIESSTRQNGPWTVGGGHILDFPKFEFRGGMLDVSRHFFGVDTIKHYIDHLARYKLNHMHLHLADDQGWRIQIDAYPQLTAIGGSTEVGGGAGGFYTKADYTEIVKYAAARYITVIPEIDMPGHVNAALASVPELNCNNQSPPLYTGVDVGFSSFCMDDAHRAVVSKFVDDVVRELAELTPGPYIHLGGDEAHSTPVADYIAFEQRTLPVVEKYGKTAMGWHDILKSTPDTRTLAQYWGTTPTDSTVEQAAKRGAKFLISAANLTYMDMKYTEATPLGQDWAGLIEVQDAYNWDPATYLTGVPSKQVVGVEAPLWTETILNLANIEFMLFPRIPALAERVWSPSTHTWDEFKVRLASQGPRWKNANIDFYASPQVPWP
ncbi:MAG TPA: beta-N-acetylhexosaminidase [Polyangiaceae bacterium]|nr:beta-N-acetylhexosaminidase [Polyangiaceae bacterium]